MKILFFGRLAEAAGTRGGPVDLPEHVASVGDLRRWMAGQDARLAAILDSPSVRTVVDDEIVGDDHALAGATETLFIPPVSGG